MTADIRLSELLLEWARANPRGAASVVVAGLALATSPLSNCTTGQTPKGRSNN